MTQIEDIDVLIVGSGPAGMSTALHLVQADPAWAGRMVVVDKATHPREKLCGGGITGLGDYMLAQLGLSIEPPNIPVREVRIIFGSHTYAVQGDPVFRVVRRDEFDHWLVQQAEQHGVRVCQGEAVKSVTPHPDYVAVALEQRTFRAQIVVAADGSRSFVRRQLQWEDNGRSSRSRTARLQLARLLEILTPEAGDKAIEFQDGVAVFDFSPMVAGLQGYVWDFPSLIKGRAFMNRGIFDSRIRPERPRAPLKEILRDALAKRGRNLDDFSLKGHPIYWFDKRSQFAQPRIILSGDAAGVDPLLGEGIPFALGYGDVSAAAVIDAFARRDFRFAAYRRQVLTHPLLVQLKLRSRLARIAYAVKSPWLLSILWGMVKYLIRFILWYNGHHIHIRDVRISKIS